MVRRRFFDFYQRYLARYTQRLPLGLRGQLAGHLFRRTRHPDFGFTHARSLCASGRSDVAAELYGNGQAVTDPLFSSQLASEGHVSGPSKGVFFAQVSFLGLRIGGQISGLGPAPVQLQIDLDGTVLRIETLSVRNGTASFRMILSREVLEAFPTSGLLRARLIDGADGSILATPEGGIGWRTTMPHGQGTIDKIISERGSLDKKGRFRLNSVELDARQTAYLDLYSELKDVYAREFNRPLLILYGTLLGQLRSGDFIPGDDDFDVGYPSSETTPETVRDEAISQMSRLAELGYVIVLNEFGRPFRIRARDGAAWVHLDNRPVFAPQQGEVWLHKHAALALDLSLFSEPETAQMRGVDVRRPHQPERFLEAYYGANWRVPDPSYSNTGRSLPENARKALHQICLSDAQQRDLAQRYPGQIVPVRYSPLYPLADYAARIGF